MNSTYSTDLRTHLTRPDQTTATGWKVTLTNGDVRGFTDLDRDVSILGVAYLSTAGYTRTDIEGSSALNVDNGELHGFLSSPSITEDDLRAGVWDYAQVEVFVFNYEDLTMGRGIMRSGTLGRVTLERSVFKAEVRGLAQKFTYTIGRLYTPGCRHILGDDKCMVDLDAGSPNWRVSGTIEGVHDDGITLYDSARTEPGPSDPIAISHFEGNPLEVVIFNSDVAQGWRNGTPIVISGVTTPAIVIVNQLTVVRDIYTAGLYTHIALGLDFPLVSYPAGGGVVNELGQDSGFFEFGTIEFTSGANAGLSMEVRVYVPGQWTLALPMPYAIEVGDTYTMTVGCNKLIATCRDKFVNTINFGGFPHLPGTDRLMQIGKQG